jgi:hypothetical protein
MEEEEGKFSNKNYPNSINHKNISNKIAKLNTRSIQLMRRKQRIFANKAQGPVGDILREG